MSYSPDSGERDYPDSYGPRHGEAGAAMTPAQERTFNELLAVGLDRPFMPAGLPEELGTLLAARCGGAVSSWKGGRLWFGKSQLSAVLRCEGQVAAAEHNGRRELHGPTVVGVVAHRAIQLAYTHPGMLVDEYVGHSLQRSLGDVDISAFWDRAGVAEQSDLRMRMISRVTNFLDSWPVLQPGWSPRFEESIQARVGGLVLAARPDILLGRPRPNRKQTMVVCDIKSGPIQAEHPAEAEFYALVSTLRFGVAPYRSTVYSLASGDYTAPDVTADGLRATAVRVGDLAARWIEVRSGRAPADLRPGLHCGWCPVRFSCPAVAPEAGAEDPAFADAAVETPGVPVVESNPFDLSDVLGLS